jgi:L-lactate dehydrogenase complex protein LldE
MLEDKTVNITATGSSLCTGGDASCLMHIGGGLSRQGSDVTTLHLAEILASTLEEPASVTGEVRVTTGKATR